MSILRKTFGCIKAKWFLSLHLLVIVGMMGGAAAQASVQKGLESQTVLFNNLPKVALLMKEQYVDPGRMNFEAMTGAILQLLESRITKLVVVLPKSLEKALELTQTQDVGAELGIESQATQPQPNAKGMEPDPTKTKDATQKSEKAPASKSTTKATPAKEKLIVDLGGTKKTFEYEPQQSIWGMLFFLRDVFRFVETEAKKQKLDISKPGEEPIEWEKIEYGVINAMLATLDPHSIFLEPNLARDLTTLTQKGEFGGIGIVISVRDGYLTVISPIDGTPASGKILAKDRIIKIDDDSAINMDMNDAVNMLRGKPGSKVRITVQRLNPNKEIEFELTRAIVKVDSVAYALLDKNVGYLRLKAFQGNTASDVKNGIMAMKKKSNNQMSGLIFDLRGNPGGLLREAVEISNLFLDGGEVVSTQGFRSDSRQLEMADAGELDPKLKIVVLVDGGSASASEIVAGAIKSGGLKNGRGIVVGEKTFGKGSVQMLFDFPAEKTGQPAALKLTIAEYFGPNNRSIQNIGVSPDVNLAPVHVGKLEETSLFPENPVREIDLEGHLANDKVGRKVDEKSLVSIEYLAPLPSEETGEYGKLDLAKLKKDFAVTVASEFIRESSGVLRKDLLAKAESIRANLQNQEHKKIIEALKKHKIDWSEGETKTKTGLVATIASNKGAISGTKLKVAVKVKNESKEPMFQVHGITHSKTPLFDQKEFIFGKLAPGQEIERYVEFEIPKDVVSRKDFLSMELRDYRREKLSELDIPLDIKGLPRPRFSHLVYVDDSKHGNGDGRVQNGEEVELNVWLKNVGEGKAFEPTVLLRNESGTKVFLKTGRFQAGELLPNQETSMKFAFRVKEPTDKINFEVQIFDGQMHDIWRDKVVINLAQKQNAKAIKRKIEIKSSSAFLYASADANSKKIATIKPGLSFETIKELGDYYLVSVDTNLSGYVKKSDVKEASAASVVPASKKREFYSVIFDRIPAKVSLKFADNKGLSKVEAGTLTAEIADAKQVSAVLLYVNGKKVLYKDMTKVSGNAKVDQQITLRPGVNVISLFAREDATYGQRENITIYYDHDGKVARATSNATSKAAKVN